MKNLAIDKIKIISAALLFLITGTASAQTVERIFNFKKGDEYYRQTAITSSCIIQMGKSQVHINSTSNVVKTYNVSDSNDYGYIFTITTKKVTSTLDVDDKHMDFDSSAPADNSSSLAKGLNYMVDKPISVSIDKHGLIVAADANAVRLSNDTLLAFTGIANEQYVAGTRFGLISDFLLQGKLDKNFTWGDTTVNGDTKIMSKFWVQAQTAGYTTIGFTSAIRGKGVNTNTNGVYVLSNTNGIIAERMLQSVSLGYIVYKKALYGSTRRWAISERCTQTK
jgi:hypothetical protein